MCGQRMPIFLCPQGPRESTASFCELEEAKLKPLITWSITQLQTHPRERLQDIQSTQKPSPHVPHPHQALSQCEQSQTTAPWLRKDFPGAGEGITCPVGIDSKESEQARAMGRSSGGRLSVDERLLARASSCTNMIPAETGWAGGQEEQLFKKRLGSRHGRALAGPNHHTGHRKEMQ